MPVVEITNEQAALLDRGKSITVGPPPREILRNLLVRYNPAGSLYFVYEAEWEGDFLRFHKYIWLTATGGRAPAAAPTLRTPARDAAREGLSGSSITIINQEGN